MTPKIWIRGASCVTGVGGEQMDGWMENGCGEEIFHHVYVFIQLHKPNTYYKLKIAQKLAALHPAHCWSWSWGGFPGRWSPRRWLSVWSTTTHGKKSWGWGGNTGHGSRKSSTIVWWVKLPRCCLFRPCSCPTPRSLSGWHRWVTGQFPGEIQALISWDNSAEGRQFWVWPAAQWSVKEMRAGLRSRAGRHQGS